MGKMSDLHLTYMENGYLIYDALKQWLINIEPSRNQLNHMMYFQLLFPIP